MVTRNRLPKIVTNPRANSDIRSMALKDIYGSNLGVPTFGEDYGVLSSKHGLTTPEEIFNFLERDLLHTPEPVATPEDLREVLQHRSLTQDWLILSFVIRHPNCSPTSQMALARAIRRTWETGAPSKTFPGITNEIDAFELITEMAYNPNLTPGVIHHLVSRGVPEEQFASHPAISGTALTRVIKGLPQGHSMQRYEAVIFNAVSVNPTLTLEQAALFLQGIKDRLEDHPTDPVLLTVAAGLINPEWKYSNIVPNDLRSRVLVGIASN